MRIATPSEDAEFLQARRVELGELLGEPLPNAVRPCPGCELPCPSAATTAHRLRALGRARPRTGLSARHLGNFDARLAAVQDVDEIDSEVVAEISAALPSTSSTARAASCGAENVTEEIIEKVTEIAEISEITAWMSATGSAHAGMPETVVAGALLCVREDGVGLGDLLETLLSRRIVRITVGMTLQRELSIGLLEVGLAGTPVDPQNLVKIPRAQTNPLFRSLRVPIDEPSSHRGQCQAEAGRSISA